MAVDYNNWINELSKRTGASVEQSDIATLQAKNPEDVDAHMKALETQYAQRGSNVTNSGGQSQPQAQASTPTQAWNTQPAPASPFPDWYGELMQRQIAQQEADRAATQQRAEALYGQLNQRATQGLNIDANDPIIKGQVDAYSAQGQRARRDYLSDIAESGGPYQNMRGEERMTAEKLGQGTSAFQAELLGREMSARRDEIAQALAMQGSILNADQSRGLQSQLAAMDQAIREAGIGMQGRGLDLQRELGMSDIDLRRTLGMEGLGLQRRGQDLSTDQFMRELALREWQLGDQSDFMWANL